MKIDEKRDSGDDDYLTTERTGSHNAYVRACVQVCRTVHIMFIHKSRSGFLRRINGKAPKSRNCNFHACFLRRLSMICRFTVAIYIYTFSDFQFDLSHCGATARYDALHVRIFRNESREFQGRYDLIEFRGPRAVTLCFSCRFNNNNLVIACAF